MDVKKVIKAHGFLMGQVAEAMGITRVTLSQNLTGNPTIKTLQKIADVIGCNIGEFFTDEMPGYSSGGDNVSFCAFVCENGDMHTFANKEDLRTFLEE